MTNKIMRYGLPAAALLLAAACHSLPTPIDRHAVVSRHNVVLTAADPLSPVQVGNGDFAYTCDITGLQTLPGYYYAHGIPLETRSTWAWYARPNTDSLRMEEAMKDYPFHGRMVPYASLQQTPAGAYFRENPHPLPLGRIALMRADGDSLQLADITSIHQSLDLWSGVVTSRYRVDGTPVEVMTAADSATATVAFTVRSALLDSGALAISFSFPYDYDILQKNKPALLWGHPSVNRTVVVHRDREAVLLERHVGDSIYYVALAWKGPARWEQAGANDFKLVAHGTEHLEVSCHFSPERPSAAVAPAADVRQASAAGWERYWTEGGIIDFSGSTDPRAPELERRVILSQYLVRVNYAGHFPPQESGLAYLSWYGKHNSEMYWWHAAQFYQWNHTGLLENGLSWYRHILPEAREEARKKGFRGAKWPKMAGIDGRPSPGTINPFIIWNEPNVIYLAELVYQGDSSRATLEKYKDLVFSSAEYMASYAFYDSLTKRYILGPPVKSVNESNAENETQDPSFELAYWYYGLWVAARWRERLGLPAEPLWDSISSKLARLTVSEGKYVEIETSPDMYSRKGHLPSDMIMALGVLPQTPMVDTAVMRRTFEALVSRNGLGSFVSWSLGKGALTAARLGLASQAVDIVSNDAAANRFSQTGYVSRPKERRSLTNPAYLPVNSSLLSAVALMAAGWQGGPPLPGFPHDGSWKVRFEGLNKLP